MHGKDRLNRLAINLLTDFLGDGVLVFARKMDEDSTDNDQVINRILQLLDKMRERYIVFDTMIADFHKQGRRRRPVRIIIRFSLFVREYVKIVPGDILANFRLRLSQEQQTEVDSFLARQTNVLVTVSGGNDNAMLCSILQNQLDASGNHLEFYSVPLLNFYNPRTSGRVTAQKANIYIAGKAVSE